MLYKVLNVSFILSIIIWNSGCTEVGDTEPEIASAGIYVGTITPTGGSSGYAMAIISSIGEVAIVNRDTMETFIGTRIDNLMAGTLYAPDRSSVSSTAEITYVSGNNISGSYSSELSGGSFALTGLTTLYNRTSELSKLTGIWVDTVFTSAIGTTTWSILPDATFTMTTPASCYGVGEFTIFNALNNEYSMMMEVTDCGDFNGLHTGLVVLSDSSVESQDDTLSIIFSNGVVAGLLEPIKQ